MDCSHYCDASVHKSALGTLALSLRRYLRSRTTIWTDHVTGEFDVLDPVNLTIRKKLPIGMWNCAQRLRVPTFIGEGDAALID